MLLDALHLGCISGQLQEQDGRDGVRGWAQTENLQRPHRFAPQHYLRMNYFTHYNSSGSVLSVWTLVESVLTNDGQKKGQHAKMQVGFLKCL